MFNPFTDKKKTPAQRKTEKPKAAYSASPEAPAKTAVRGERKITGVIGVPHLTEKTSRANAGGWYSFRADAGATKIMIRRAIEDRYGVHVRGVRIINQRGKKMRLGRISGMVPGFKKAMVKVAQGERIDIQ